MRRGKREEGRNRERKKRRERRGPGVVWSKGSEDRMGQGGGSSEQAPVPVWDLGTRGSRGCPGPDWTGRRSGANSGLGAARTAWVEGLASVSKWSYTGLSRTVWSLMAKLGYLFHSGPA